MKLISSSCAPQGVGMSRLRAVAACLLLTASLAGPVAAIEMADLYTVSVPLDPANPETRNEAHAAAMKRVLVRVTGDPNAGESEELQAIFTNPSRYVMRYRSGPDNTLLVTLDGEAIEAILRRSGHATWSNDRPATLVWLAVDWGQGQREIVAAQDLDTNELEETVERNRLLRERVMEVAEERGIPVLFPLLDAEDLTNVSFSDIWAGFDDRLLTASARYDVSSVLVGRVRTVGLGQNRWTYYFGNDVLTWSGQPEEVVNLLADSLASELAVAPNTRLETIRLSVTGVDSVVAYGAVQRLLNDLNLVEDFSVDSVMGGEIDYLVKVYGGSARLSKALELSGVLQPAEVGPLGLPPVTGGNSLTFDFRPETRSQLMQ